MFENSQHDALQQTNQHIIKSLCGNIRSAAQLKTELAVAHIQSITADLLSKLAEFELACLGSLRNEYSKQLETYDELSKFLENHKVGYLKKEDETSSDELLLDELYFEVINELDFASKVAQFDLKPLKKLRVSSLTKRLEPKTDGYVLALRKSGALLFGVFSQSSHFVELFEISKSGDVELNQKLNLIYDNYILHKSSICELNGFVYMACSYLKGFTIVYKLDECFKVVDKSQVEHLTFEVRAYGNDLFMLVGDARSKCVLRYSVSANKTIERVRIAYGIHRFFVDEEFLVLYDKWNNSLVFLARQTGLVVRKLSFGSSISPCYDSGRVYQYNRGLGLMVGYDLSGLNMKSVKFKFGDFDCGDGKRFFGSLADLNEEGVLFFNPSDFTVYF